MFRPTSVLRPASLSLMLCVIGCSEAVRSTDEASAINPIREAETLGTLVATVDGYPRDIRYYINDVRIIPDERIKWSQDARFEIELKPGFYQVEAKYLVRGFADDRTEYLIESTEPVEVRSGQVTYLLAHLEKDFRGVPEFEITPFVEVTAGEHKAHWSASGPISWAEASAAADAADEAPPDVVPEPTREPTPELKSEGEPVPQAQPESMEPETIIIHGPGSSSDGAGYLEPSIEVPGLRDAPAIGEEEIPAVETVDPSAQAVVPGDSESDPDPDPDSDPGPDPDPGPDSNSGPTITVLVSSQPTGASVRFDGRDVGTTPVQLTLDPTADHVVQLEHDECGGHVQLLPAAGWERGRSTSIDVELECPH